MTGADIYPDIEQIRDFLTVLMRPGEVYEVRIPSARRGSPMKFWQTTSGYFNDPIKAAQTLSRVTGRDAPAVYVTLNPVKKDLLARANNRLETKALTTTSDDDVPHRRTILIDVDPARATGISATDEEMAAAIRTRDEVRAYLSEMGWPEPLVVSMSGSGGALVYRVDLENTAENTATIEKVLAALASIFTTDDVKFDTTVSNAARITKVVGSVAARGDHVPELGRKWRVATGDFNPDAGTVTLKQLQEVGGQAGEPETTAPAAHRQVGRLMRPATETQFDTSGKRSWKIADVLRDKGIGYSTKEKAGITAYQLDRCLTSEDHTDGAAIIETSSGVLAYKCMHDRCIGKRWADVKPDLMPEHSNGTTAAPEPIAFKPRDQVAVVARVPDPVEPRTLAEVDAVFGRWLYLEDPAPLYAMLATVAANRMVGDPQWLMLVGASSGGKTELLTSLSRLPNVHAAATLTEAGLLSGTPKREVAAGARGGLLRQIGDFGFLVAKDFTSVLSMNRDARAALLAALREVYDGSWTRHVGVDGGKELHWSGKVALIGGCTAAIDGAHSVTGAMGERWLTVRMPDLAPRRQAARALRITGHEQAMRAELSAAVAGLFAGLVLPEVPPELDDEESTRLIALASLVARCRSGVERDGRTREVELILDSEAPARLVLSLRRLYSGLRAIGLDTSNAWRVVEKVAFDSMPRLRRVAFEALAHTGDPTPTSTVAVKAGYPTQTTRRALEDLSLHGVVHRKKGGKGKEDLWSLTPFAMELMAETGTFPEMLGDMKRAANDDSADPAPPIYSPSPVPTNISGKVPTQANLPLSEGADEPPTRSCTDCGGLLPASRSYTCEACTGRMDININDGHHGSYGDNPPPDDDEAGGMRVSNCWQCKKPLATGFDQECDSCGWLICECGACGQKCDSPAAMVSERN